MEKDNNSLGNVRVMAGLDMSKPDSTDLLHIEVWVYDGDSVIDIYP